MTPTRFRVLGYYLSGKRNGVKLKELFNFFFDGSYAQKTKKVVTKIEQGRDANKAYFKGFKEPLHYPSDFPKGSLECVVNEVFFEDNWHFYEIPQTKVEPNDVVVDCGAAEGLFSYIVVGRCKKIYMIEPLKKFNNTLNLSFRGYNNVEVLNIALSNEEGVATMNDQDIASSLSYDGKGAQVQVSTLDKEFYEKGIAVNYIKIDVEGYDVKTLQGGAELIKKNKPKIAVTTYHSKEHAEEIKKFLLSIVPGYNILCKGIFQNSGCPIMLHAWI